MKTPFYHSSRQLISLLIIAILFTGCAYQKFIKTAQKYEQSGMYKPAVDNYLLSLNKKKDKNDKAKIGLMRVSKRYSDEIITKIDEAYNTLNDDQVVKSYLELEALKEKVGVYSVEIDVSSKTIGQYKEAKNRFLRSAYAKAQQLIDKEMFDEAATELAGVVKVDKTYEKAAELYLFALCEPLYRKANKNMQSKLYRSAYHDLTKIMSYDKSYKDVVSLQREAQNNAMLTIAMQPPGNAGYFPYLSEQIAAKIKAKFQSANNPFLKIVALNYTAMMLEEQKKALANNLSFDAGSIIPVRVYLNSAMNTSDYQTSQPKYYEKKAYYKYLDQNKQIRYKKVLYYEIQQTCQMSFAYNFEFTSTENATVLASSKIERTLSDEVNFAKSEYPVSDLYPGDWGAGIRDTVYTDIIRRGLMVAMFNKRSKLLTRQELENSFADIVATEVYNKIDWYNPEK
jgi:hypothetical protein